MKNVDFSIHNKLVGIFEGTEFCEFIQLDSERIHIEETPCLSGVVRGRIKEKK